MGNHAHEHDLRQALERLRAEVVQDLAQVRELLPLEPQATTLVELERDLESQLERARAAAVITLVGATGAGKSTLLNALVGQAIAREGESRPTTRAPVLYRPVDADVSRLIAGLPGEPPQIVDYDPDLGGPWREQILIDAPDINSIAEEHREIVRLLAARSDVLVVVAHRQSVSELSSVSFVDAFAGRRGMIFVLNRADELTEAAREELVAKIRELARERWRVSAASVIATSARQARTQAGVPGWSELCERLQELVAEGLLGRVRRHNAVGTAVRIQEAVALGAGGLESTLAEVEREARAGLDGWRRALEPRIDERLALRATQVRELLWNEAARRWDGPGGYALRAGSLSSLGLGAGALLARRNPLIAAGAAAGALAADRAREYMRERALSDSGALLPSEHELEGLYRGELAGLRLSATRLYGCERPTPVPEPARLAGHALRAVSTSWDELVERDLARAAEAGVRAPLRWAFDLPVYAFGLWIVYRAAHSLWSTESLGLDLLVDAGILLFAWLFLARCLVRALLALRCKGLLAGLRRRVGDQLEQAVADELAPLERDLAARGAALERLRRLEQRARACIEG